MRRWLIALCLAVLAVVPARVAAQSLFAQGGLGVPVEALDARFRGQGSLGIGLFGVSLTPADPAAAHSAVPTLTVTLQPTWGEFNLNGQTGELQGQRFPVMGAAYPAFQNQGMFSVTFGSFMDQRWAVEAADTLDLAGNSTEVRDSFDSNGGISTVRLGYAHQITRTLVVAANVGAMTGQITRAFSRQFDSTTVDAGVDDFEVQGRWRWSGPAGALGLRWDPSPLLRVSASANFYGALKATPQDSTAGPTFEFDLPIEFRAGTNVQLTPTLLLNASGSYADWSVTDASLAADSLPPGEAAAGVTGLGGGVEWSGLSLAGKTFPLRLGYRRQDLPFKFQGDVPVESTFSAGLGFNLAQQENVVLARMDMAIEKGDRSGGTLTEEFWRFTLSFTAAGR